MFSTKNIWNSLPLDIKEHFQNEAQHLIFKRGESVYQQGGQPKGIYFVQKGLVGLVLLGENSGKEHLLRFFKAGDFFGHRSLFSEESYHGNTLALEQTEILLVPKSIWLEASVTHSEILQIAVKVLANELKQSELQRVLILENQILSRVARSLVYLKDLHPEHNWTRQEIANFCASTVSTVIKALSDLESKGLISQTGRIIEVIKRDELVALQEFV